MKEKTLLKTALITSLLGLLILYLISSNIEIKEKNIEKITLDNKDEFVKLRGIVNKVIDTEKVTIMEITQPQQITVVLFKDDNSSMPIQQGNEIEIFGKVDEYEEQLGSIDGTQLFFLINLFSDSLQQTRLIKELIIVIKQQTF